MSLGVFKATRPVQVSDLVKREIDMELCRERFTLLAGDGAARSVELGTPLGKISASGTITATQAAVAGNTGDGTLTLANPAFADGAKTGVYTVTCTTGGADGTSKFRVEDPDGVLVGTATGGAAFDKAVKFTIAGGATAFVAGDAFTVTLARAAGANDAKVKEWDPAATDGSEVIWGFSLRSVTAADGVDNTTDGLAIRRMSVLRSLAIKWPAGTTDAQKAAALSDIEERLVLVART
ncbi:head decoration protein [Ciceribacter ferrooxidans]|uniref:Head decoration protein n=1 Tax=Ciceribacter ferrooxidans TaxID=2509717 RepID=A0A4Q2T0Q4_9HYPH|nr:head decoration protein [Ciceribacter ferrooxidans]RYC10169.1 head decoration protein [Ciceribacter ferrooxidans]